MRVGVACVLLAGAGTAALWGVERGVVTSAASDPARVGNEAGADDATTVTPPPQVRDATDHSRQPYTGPVVTRAPLAQGSQNRDPVGTGRGASEATAPAAGPDEQTGGQPRRPFWDFLRSSRTPTTSRPAAGRPPVVAADSRGGDTSDSAEPIQASDVDLEFWVEWGGGEPRAWFGTLRLDAGRITSARGYGLQADTPGASFLADNKVTISPRLPRAFDSLLVRVTAPRNANLEITYVANGSSTGAVELRIPLVDLVESTQHRTLDDRGNKLIVRRAARNRLRLGTNRESFVFAPAETFEFTVHPNLVDATERKRRCHVHLQPARGGSSLWSDQREAVSAPDGTFSPVGPFAVTMPQQEGVYDLFIALDNSRYWRKVQLIVVAPHASRGDQAADGDEGQFQVVQTYDPASSPLPLAITPDNAPRIRNQPARQPMAHGDVAPTRRFDRQLLEIGPDSWFALPLRVTRPGLPHVVEIDYPNDAVQTLGIAVYEPGQRRPVVDTGLLTTERTRAATPGLTTYRLTFWPYTASPVLVLTQRGAEQRATVGPIRVAAGPGRLPDLAIDGPRQGRLLAAHVDTAMFPRLFSATSEIDRDSGRELRDWVTFYEGAERLIQVLKRRGYNGAVIPVLADGGSLYPSRLLDSTPRFDDGIFFSTAQDPAQKDVLELLLRMFDREGLKLVPSVKFTGTLPGLEETRRRGDRPSIRMIDGEGNRWRPQPGSFGAGPHYNPLDEEVQEAIRQVVAELATRCTPHPSFAGVAVELDPESYATLPGSDWGADEHIVKQFMAEHKATSPDSLGEDELREAWLAWRARRLAAMYAAMTRGLVRGAPQANLFLLGAELFNAPAIAATARADRAPSGMTADRALLEFGLNAKLLREAGVSFLAPRQMAPVPPDLVDLDRAWDREYARLFGPRGEGITGSQLGYPKSSYLAHNLAELFSISGLTNESRARYGETGAVGRRGIAHELASMDSRVIVDGAWQTPRHDRTWQDAIIAFRQLPDLPFETVHPPVGAKTQPVMIRRTRRSESTVFYVVNDSPQPVVTKLGFGGDPRLTLKSLSARSLPPLEKTEQGASLLLILRPFQIVSFSASLPDVEIVTWETLVDPEVLARVRTDLERLNHWVTTKRDYPRVKNADFDQPATTGGLPGWVFAEGEGIHVALDTDAPRHGEQSVHLHSETPVDWSNGPVVWLRSDWFPPASSGRLVFGGWLKTRDFEHQPHVRLLVEGRLPDNQVVRRERVLGHSPDHQNTIPLGADWNYYAVFAEDMPANVAEVRVGIDLRGTGDVWLDHVGVFDLWLNDREQDGLQRDIGIAQSMLDEGRVLDAQHLLNSHHSQYLFANFLGQTGTEPVTPALTDESPASDALPDPAGELTDLPPAIATRPTDDQAVTANVGDTAAAGPTAPPLPAPNDPAVPVPAYPTTSAKPYQPVARPGAETEQADAAPSNDVMDEPSPLVEPDSPADVESSAATPSRTPTAPRTLENLNDTPRQIDGSTGSSSGTGERVRTSPFVPPPPSRSAADSRPLALAEDGRAADGNRTVDAESRADNSAHDGRSATQPANPSTPRRLGVRQGSNLRPQASRPPSAHTPVRPARTDSQDEPKSWFDKLKEFKFKLPERRPRPPREGRSMFDWLSGESDSR